MATSATRQRVPVSRVKNRQHPGRRKSIHRQQVEHDDRRSEAEDHGNNILERPDVGFRSSGLRTAAARRSRQPLRRSSAPRERRVVSPMTFARQTKTFPTEAEAKQFAKEMLLSDRKNIISGTLLSDHDPARRIISGWDVRRWTEDS
jgi:hypothetical protein